MKTILAHATDPDRDLQADIGRYVDRLMDVHSASILAQLRAKHGSDRTEAEVAAAFEMAKAAMRPGLIAATNRMIETRLAAMDAAWELPGGRA